MSRVWLAARVRPPAERARRVRRRTLQMPVVRFEHQRTGRTVTVAGVVHIAPASYYRQLNAILAKLEAAGALICYEHVAPAEDTQWSAVGPAERDGWNAGVVRNREMSQAERLIVDDRNERALAGLPSDQDSVLIWGVFREDRRGAPVP